MRNIKGDSRESLEMKTISINEKWANKTWWLRRIIKQKWNLKYKSQKFRRTRTSFHGRLAFVYSWYSRWLFCWNITNEPIFTIKNCEQQYKTLLKILIDIRLIYYFVFSRVCKKWLFPLNISNMSPKKSKYIHTTLALNVFSSF